ncbi:hypothetical protein AMTR_s00146p00024230 [Amborella trichopoda]|uniref:Uncharacterized protein n=1 Tax=Amborella trichopoda TaxID=13333 RepID=W1PA70_AMBTC|nr:hypothetical protein AMTR_s00146p00024230 [Amborella trichopoda]
MDPVSRRTWKIMLTSSLPLAQEELETVTYPLGAHHIKEVNDLLGKRDCTGDGDGDALTASLGPDVIKTEPSIENGVGEIDPTRENEVRDTNPSKENEVREIAFRDGSAFEEKANPSISTSQYTSDHMAKRNPSMKPPLSHRVFTASRLDFAISASQNIRLLCAATIALLVLCGNIVSSLTTTTLIGRVILSWPLYNLLLTDATIVLGFMLMNLEKEKRDEKRRETGLEVNYGLVESLGNVLELGLVIQRVTQAIFMDVSIYAVLVVSGLSLIKYGL